MPTKPRQSLTIIFAGHEFELLSSGGLYWPLKKTLIVSDLHLEKGSYFATRGQPLPITDTRCTLERLDQEINRLNPETLICLGDNVHDAQGFMRMVAQDLSLLQTLHQKVNHWQWIIGNHDTFNIEKPPLENMQFIPEVSIENLCFSHDYQKDKLFQIIGHYHPKISVKIRGAKISGKCFSVSQKRIILPSFGSYTGGLEVHHQIYNEILKGLVQYYIIYKGNIFLAK